MKTHWEYLEGAAFSCFTHIFDSSVNPAACHQYSCAISIVMSFTALLTHAYLEFFCKDGLSHVSFLLTFTIQNFSISVYFTLWVLIQ
jgi:hypothetical protein